MELLFNRSVTLETRDPKDTLHLLTLYMRDGSPEIFYADEYLARLSEGILCKTYDRELLTNAILTKWKLGYNLTKIAGKAVEPCFLGKDLVDKICTYFLPDQILPDINWTNTSLVCPVW